MLLVPLVTLSRLGCVSLKLGSSTGVSAHLPPRGLGCSDAHWEGSSGARLRLWLLATTARPDFTMQENERKITETPVKYCKCQSLLCENLFVVFPLDQNYIEEKNIVDCWLDGGRGLI